MSVNFIVESVNRQTITPIVLSFAESVDATI